MTRAFICLSLVLSLSAEARTVKEARTIKDGVYTKAQAEAGEKLYKKHCQTCHDKKYFKPVLKAWSGQNLETFFMTMATTMPEANPGMLYGDEYVRIIAHILAQNKFAAGDNEPPTDPEQLALIVISP